MIVVGIILIAILAVVVSIMWLFGTSFMGSYSIVTGIKSNQNTEIGAWDYWELMKIKSWDELSYEEKNRLTIACMIISDDIGVVFSEDQVIKMLESQLPVMIPNEWLSYHCRE